MKEFTLFDLDFELEKEKPILVYNNCYGFVIRGLFITGGTFHDEKYIEFSNYKSHVVQILIRYDWQDMELEEDALDILKDTRILEYIFKYKNEIENQIIAHEQFVIENKAFVEKLDKLDKYKILL